MTHFLTDPFWQDILIGVALLAIVMTLAYLLYFSVMRYFVAQAELEDAQAKLDRLNRQIQDLTQ